MGWEGRGREGLCSNARILHCIQDYKGLTRDQQIMFNCTAGDMEFGNVVNTVTFLPRIKILSKELQVITDGKSVLKHVIM